MFEWLESTAVTYGPVGVFAVSLLGSLLPFVPVPYLFVVVLLSDTVDPVILGLASGIGGSLGKITSYVIGRMGYRLLDEQRQKRMDALREIIGKYGEIGVFVFALTPLPDDVYLIPAGMVRLNFWRFLFANTAGKIILATLVAFLGRTYFQFAEILLGESTWISTAAAVLAMVAITVILLRIDWENILKTVKKSGWKGIFQDFKLWKR
ncbi:MAG: VTT domain-containing protein [Candidatus Caldarchaeum sp.]|nr:VTT domain-containing protein [Candidatus Caldarchaeum sp.]MDW8063066.1 VTT domain-containing protein [Candidatus Caldarchaeum sp.]